MFLRSNHKKRAIKIKTNEEFCDNLGLTCNKEVYVLLKKYEDLSSSDGVSQRETVVYSGFVQKANSWKNWQQRILLITDRAVYNILPSDLSSCRRRIPISLLTSMTISQKSDEFILHVPSEYDYRMTSKQKVEVMKAIQKAYYSIVGNRLDVELTSLKCLKSICLTKQKAKKKHKKSAPQEIKVVDENNPRINAPPSPEPLSSKASETSCEYFDAQSHVSNEWKPRPEDFIPVRVLGRGSFGKVMLVRRTNSMSFYAMKSLHKSAIVTKEQINHTKEERKILVSISHPFLVKLHFAFQTKTKLYFVMDYLKGGELFYHLRRHGRFSNNRALLYTAEIVLGVGHLHKKNIIYRDLKPENVLLDQYGHICLTDFGLSKVTSTKTNTFCGTPEYLAPEVIAGKGHDKSIDWWSLGVLLFEMLVGVPPFYSEDSTIMYERIKYMKLKIPPHVSHSAAQLIAQLLKRNPSIRIGNCPLDYKIIMMKNFFTGIDWNHVINRRYIPEYVPEESAVSDTSNFDIEFTSEPVVDSLVTDCLIPTDKSNHEINFSQFTFNEDRILN